MNINDKKKFVDKWFSYMQIQICSQFENLENKISKKPKRFKSRVWNKSKKKEGGGISCLLSEGKIFEKVGVNKSTVQGTFGKDHRSKIYGAERNGKYWASGISVVAHMQNPKIPAIHFNTRFIVTTKQWFGGGIDMTPCIKDKKEEKNFHQKLEEICKKNNKNYHYYRKWCDNYFYLKHRKEPRGVGGIFFDYEKKNWEQNFKFVRDLGLSFIDMTSKIILNKLNSKWTIKDKEKQLIKRGRYVEFNLLYDRGTKFGLHSDGNVDSILMSMPPQAKWK